MGENKIIVDRWLDKQVSISIGKLLLVLIIFFLSFFVFSFLTNRGINQNNENGLEISNLIRQVKTELMKADTERINKNEAALFALKDFQMEISFTVRSVNKGGAKVDYKFVTVEGGSQTGNEKVQKLTLHWDAIREKPDTLWNGIEEDGIIIKPNNQ